MPFDVIRGSGKGADECFEEGPVQIGSGPLTDVAGEAGLHFSRRGIPGHDDQQIALWLEHGRQMYTEANRVGEAFHVQTGAGCGLMPSR